MVQKFFLFLKNSLVIQKLLTNNLKQFFAEVSYIKINLLKKHEIIFSYKSKVITAYRSY